jgi:stage II sporulation protein D
MTTRRTAVAAALTGLAAVTVTGLAHAGAPAQAPEVRIPDRATITVNGHGFGHGHGLSQYGAEGAARRGLTGAQIVRFYYPHTRAGQARGPVRVHITADTDGNTTILARSGLKVRNLDNGSVSAVPTRGAAGKASRWRLSAGAGGATKVSYLHSGWHLWKTLHGDAEFRAAGPLKLVLPSSVVTYRGTLQLRTLPAARAPQRVTVNRVPLDDYVRGVIPREMPALWHQAALRAQAIAARTYAAFEEADSTNPVYQLCDTTSCQVYGGLSAELSSTNEATRATAGQIRTYRGEPAFTQFSASSGGWTSDGGKPYLPAQRDPYDGWSGNHVHTWSTTVTSGAVEKAWPALGNLTGITVDSRDGHGQWNGRVLTMTLHGSKKDVALSGDAFRLGLGLRSTWFSLGTVTRAAPARQARGAEIGTLVPST